VVYRRRHASRQLHHQQAVLPTRSGAFLCEVDEDGAGLVAKTWIRRAEDSSRHAAPLRIAKEYFIGSGGEQGIGLEIAPCRSPPRFRQFKFLLRCFASWSESLG
jgi:hypothetical protein